MLVGLFLVVLSAAPVKPEALELEAGGQKVLEVTAGTKAKVADGKVLEVKAVGDAQLLLVGVAAGSTRLELRSRDGKLKAYAVKVSEPDPKKLIAEIRSLLGDLPGVTLVDDGKLCFEVDCDGCSAADEQRAMEVAALFPCIHSVHSIVPRRKPEVVLAGVRELLGEGPGDTMNLVLDVVKGQVVLRGEVQTAEDARRVIAARDEYPELLVRVKLPPPEKSDGGRR